MLTLIAFIEIHSKNFAPFHVGVVLFRFLSLSMREYLDILTSKNKDNTI